MKTSDKARRTGAGATILVCALAACSSGKGEQKSQVVARVNDAEITMLQLQAALTAKGGAQPTREATRQTVNSLVNEQLLVDAAIAGKLDRDPLIVQSVESARRQLLARAYLERSVFPKQDISVADQTAYYKGHPALFAQRRTYQLILYNIAQPVIAPDVMETLAAAHTAEAVSATLAAHSIEAETQSLTRAAEQLPVEQLPKFSVAEVGDIIVQPPQDGHITLMLVSGIQSSPLPFESAQPIIQQYLVNRRNLQALEAHLKQARATARIHYVDAALATTAAAAPTPPRPAGLDTF
jgi:EpsD family peptidyl-prolyl cis-trans isomerase